MSASVVPTEVSFLATGSFKHAQNAFNISSLTGKPLIDEYVKKQVNDYREQAKAFGLAK